MRLKTRVQESLDVLKSRQAQTPDIAIVLGSGLGGFVSHLEDRVEIPSHEIPHVPRSTVPGHKGYWIFGRLGTLSVMVLQGRVHLYEGYSAEVVAYPIHVLASMGVKYLILTTSCGGLNPDFRPGDLMLITDILNVSFRNPLIGHPEDQLGPRFPDMSHPFSDDLNGLAIESARELGQPLREGIFGWMTGPNYETRAEVQLLRRFGVSAVSMSTAPEVIVANQRHLEVMGMALITNLATGLSSTPLSHHEVTQRAHEAGERLALLLIRTVTKLATRQTG
jgi:purine-nucleoside phosphorylase